MELRSLEYFLAIVREESLSRAANVLHLSQPALTRQLKLLEDEFGKQLVIRGGRGITLTEEGMLLRRRAEEIVTLARQTTSELTAPEDAVIGDIYIGAGETPALRHIAMVARTIQERHRDIRFHITSGDTADLLDRLDKGLFDFCLLMGEVDQTRYERIDLPYRDQWGVLMRRDAPLASKKSISPKDLWDQPLILSRQVLTNPQQMKWFGRPLTKLWLAGTYNLAYNASLMALEGMGYVITLKGIINVRDTDLCFRPLNAASPLEMSLVWKKYQPKTRAAELFISTLADCLANDRAE